LPLNAETNSGKQGSQAVLASLLQQLWSRLATAGPKHPQARANHLPATTSTELFFFARVKAWRALFPLDRTATDRPAFPADRPAPLLAAPHSSSTLFYWCLWINHGQACSCMQLPQLCWPQQQQHSTQQQTPLLASAAQHEQCWCVKLEDTHQGSSTAAGCS
jgi:hypothetical protein